MPRGTSTFRQRDVTAAIKAALAAGIEVARVEVGKDGKIVVVTTGKSDGIITPPSPETDAAEIVL